MALNEDESGRRVADERGGSPFAHLPAPTAGKISSRGVKLAERIASTLVQDIIDAGLGPGERLPNEAAMAQRFEVGRGSVREALRILEVHGLISLRSGPKGGPVIVAVDPRDVGRTLSIYLSVRGATMAELIQTRHFLEPVVARLAAENRTDEEADRLKEFLAQERNTSRRGDYLDAANDFHYLLATMTGNRVVDLMATALKELYTTRLIATGVATATTDPTLGEEHRDIGDAIIDGDGDRAEARMRAHMGVYEERVRETAPGFRASRLVWE
ncbi:MAG: hypothetical protein ABS81_10955 [Pseudonocardia sp. SCN 72-86]|nr:MAG: hypothetical protein ABS81_10955 [Pseudonocardia sp. SCN 72-86]